MLRNGCLPTIFFRVFASIHGPNPPADLIEEVFNVDRRILVSADRFYRKLVPRLEKVQEVKHKERPHSLLGLVSTIVGEFPDDLIASDVRRPRIGRVPNGNIGKPFARETKLLKIANDEPEPLGREEFLQVGARRSLPGSGPPPPPVPSGVGHGLDANIGHVRPEFVVDEADRVGVTNALRCLLSSDAIQRPNGQPMAVSVKSCERSGAALDTDAVVQSERVRDEIDAKDRGQVGHSVDGQGI